MPVIYKVSLEINPITFIKNTVAYA